MAEPDTSAELSAAAASSNPPLTTVVRTRRARLSMVWLVPLLALAIGAGLVVRNVLATGPRIEIHFRTAEGLEPGKTEVRFKEVAVGRVQAVTLSADREAVVARVQLDRSAASLAVEDTQFWVVRPRIGTSGVSGLNTLLSGAYIGLDAGESSQERSAFTGLEAAPYVLRGEPGAVFVLRADDLGSLDIGSPVYYRRTKVGRVVGFTLDAPSDELQVKIFIESPYERLVTTQTRFWNASGVDLSIDANGLTLNTQTVTSMLAGGLAFGHPPGDSTTPAAAGSIYTLFDNRKQALAPPLGPALPVRMVFDGSVRGLNAGAPIDFLGVEIGTVRSVSLQYDAQRKSFPVQVLADIHPQRLGAVRSAVAAASGASQLAANSTAAHLAVLQRLVDTGLRAQVRTGNLLTGQLYIAMDFYPKAMPATLNDQGGRLNLPTMPGGLNEIQSQVTELMQRLGKLPLEKIADGLAGTAQQAHTSLRELTPELRALLTEGRQTLVAAQTLVAQLGPEAQQSLAALRQTASGAQATLDRVEQNLIAPGAPLQRSLEATLLEVQRAAQAMRLLADALQRHPESLLRGTPGDASLPALGTRP